MSKNTPSDLPVIGSHPIDEEAASCSPKIYISNEEKAILGAMRRLHEKAVELRNRLAEAGSDDERRLIDSELAELRSERAELAVRREQAFKRKMIMLGHLPPDDEVSLF